MARLSMLSCITLLGLTYAAPANTSACGQLAAQFPSQLYTPGSSNYTAESTAAIWSQTCHREPACVFSPFTAEDVAAALTIIRETETVFSVRGGGHMPVPGAQSNDDGVLIAMTNLNSMKLSADQSVASIGTGSRWIHVYTWIADYGLAVAGGRYGQVGVGGLLTGGGINYFGNLVGWSISTVVGMQVVLANSTIVEASATSNADLFWAVRGGNNNFGIVTRFDLSTLPLTTMYGGGAQWFGPEATQAVIDGIQSFILPGGGIDDPNTEINPSLAVMPSMGVYVPNYLPFVLGEYCHAPRSLENFTTIPDPILNVTYQRETWLSVPIEAAAFDSVGMRQRFHSLSLKAAPGVVQMTADAVLEPAMQALSSVTNSSCSVNFQPIGQLMLQAAKDAGGDALDLDPADGSMVVVLTSCTWANESDDETVDAFFDSMAVRVETLAKEAGVFLPFIYLNDAGAGQNPFAAYGKGESLPRLLEIQQRYDPDEVLKNLLTGAFKL